jgi:hypothetical protein
MGPKVIPANLVSNTRFSLLMENLGFATAFFNSKKLFHKKRLIGCFHGRDLGSWKNCQAALAFSIKKRAMAREAEGF